MDPTNPSYYGHDLDVIECADYIESHKFDFFEGNVIKYVTRYVDKNGIEDLKKARWYLDRLIKREERGPTSYDSSLYEAVLKSEDVSNDLNHLKCGSSEELDAISWATCDH